VYITHKISDSAKKGRETEEVCRNPNRLSTAATATATATSPSPSLEIPARSGTRD
ncbi:unnamed protein product, partial [Musa hybrid cultivar]